MTNEFLFLGILLFNLGLTVGLYRFFGRIGLYVVIVYSSILCNILVLKQVEFLGIAATLGNILYGGIFFATDILNEKYGPREARRSVAVGFISILVLTFFVQTALLYIPGEDDWADEHMQALFGFIPRIALASFVAYLISQLLDISVFQFFKKKSGDKKLWLRNNVSTLVSQTLDTLIFTVVAFWGVFPTDILFQIFITALGLKAFVALCDTPFFYLAMRFEPTED